VRFRCWSERIAVQGRDRRVALTQPWRGRGDLRKILAPRDGAGDGASRRAARLGASRVKEARPSEGSQLTWISCGIPACLSRDEVSGYWTSGKETVLNHELQSFVLGKL